MTDWAWNCHEVEEDGKKTLSLVWWLSLNRSANTICWTNRTFTWLFTSLYFFIRIQSNYIWFASSFRFVCLTDFMPSSFQFVQAPLDERVFLFLLLLPSTTFDELVKLQQGNNNNSHSHNNNNSRSPKQVPSESAWQLRGSIVLEVPYAFPSSRFECWLATNWLFRE